MGHPIKLLLFLLLAYSTAASAINQAACSKLLNDGLYKKYEYGGIDQPLTKATKKHGLSKSTSVTSTEATTALLDPKYWSNITTSETQSTSSYGPCSAIALEHLRKIRNLYIAQNKDEVFNQISLGQGEHLNVLAVMSLCESKSLKKFNQSLQGKMKDFIFHTDDKNLGTLLDKAILSNKKLATTCYSWI